MRRRCSFAFHLFTASFIASALCACDSGPSDGPPVVPRGDHPGTPPGPSEGSGLAPVVLWPRPAHAHPDVPLAFTFVAFDPENETLRFALDGAPDGMTIDANGTLHWDTPVLGSYAMTLEVDDGRADALEVPFTLDVDPARFVFVAPEGHADATGTIDDPLDDIEAAMAAVRDLGWGTVFVRGGVYDVRWQWEVDGHPSPLRGIQGTSETPVSVRGYPGESVVIDCVREGHGPWSAGGDYVIFADLEVRNANAPERGGIVLEGHALAQNVTVRDSDWAAPTNCTGFLVRGDEAICHRCRAIDNYDRASEHWNSSNYLVYLDGEEASGTRYILDSASSGSIAGIKVKHAGPARLLVHASRSTDEVYGIAVADDGSEVSYCTIENADAGLTMGIADPNEHTRGDVSMHHNTVVQSRVPLSVHGSYADEAPVRVYANVFSTTEPLGDSDLDTLMTIVAPYSDVPEVQLEMSGNCYAAPSFETGFRIGRPTRSFTDWQALGFDATSVATTVSPFVADFLVDANSECAALGAGAWH